MCIATAITLGTVGVSGLVTALITDVAVTAAVAGGVMGIVGSVQQAEQQKEMANFQAEQEAENARLARKEAEAIKVQGDQEKSQLRQKMLMQRSSARTGFASGGVILGGGSTLDYEADIADAYDMDSRNLEYDIKSRQWQSHVRAANATSQSQMYRSQAQAAERSKTTSILSGTFSTIGDTLQTGISTYGGMNKLMGKK